jgi:hypothetical protein
MVLDVEAGVSPVQQRTPLRLVDPTTTITGYDTPPPVDPRFAYVRFCPVTHGGARMVMTARQRPSVVAALSVQIVPWRTSQRRTSIDRCPVWLAMDRSEAPFATAVVAQPAGGIGRCSPLVEPSLLSPALDDLGHNPDRLSAHSSQREESLLCRFELLGREDALKV